MVLPGNKRLDKSRKYIPYKFRLSSISTINVPINLKRICCSLGFDQILKNMDLEKLLKENNFIDKIISDNQEKIDDLISNNNNIKTIDNIIDDLNSQVEAIKQTVNKVDINKNKSNGALLNFLTIDNKYQTKIVDFFTKKILFIKETSKIATSSNNILRVTNTPFLSLEKINTRNILDFNNVNFLKNMETYKNFSNLNYSFAIHCDILIKFKNSSKTPSFFPLHIGNDNKYIKFNLLPDFDYSEKFIIEIKIKNKQTQSYDFNLFKFQNNKKYTFIVTGINNNNNLNITLEILDYDNYKTLFKSNNLFYVDEHLYDIRYTKESILKSKPIIQDGPTGFIGSNNDIDFNGQVLLFGITDINTWNKLNKDRDLFFKNIQNANQTILNNKNQTNKILNDIKNKIKYQQTQINNFIEQQLKIITNIILPTTNEDKIREKQKDIENKLLNNNHPNGITRIYLSSEYNSELEMEDSRLIYQKQYNLLTYYNKIKTMFNQLIFLKLPEIKNNTMTIQKNTFNKNLLQNLNNKFILDLSGDNFLNKWNLTFYNPTNEFQYKIILSVDKKIEFVGNNNNIITDEYYLFNFTLFDNLKTKQINIRYDNSNLTNIKILCDIVDNKRLFTINLNNIQKKMEFDFSKNIYDNTYDSIIEFKNPPKNIKIILHNLDFYNNIQAKYIEKINNINDTLIEYKNNLDININKYNIAALNTQERNILTEEIKKELERINNEQKLDIVEEKRREELDKIKLREISNMSDSEEMIIKNNQIKNNQIKKKIETIDSEKVLSFLGLRIFIKFIKFTNVNGKDYYKEQYLIPNTLNKIIFSDRKIPKFNWKLRNLSFSRKEYKNNIFLRNDEFIIKSNFNNDKYLFFNKNNLVTSSYYETKIKILFLEFDPTHWNNKNIIEYDPTTWDKNDITVVLQNANDNSIFYPNKNKIIVKTANEKGKKYDKTTTFYDVDISAHWIIENIKTPVISGNNYLIPNSEIYIKSAKTGEYFHSGFLYKNWNNNWGTKESYEKQNLPYEWNIDTIESYDKKNSLINLIYNHNIALNENKMIKLKDNSFINDSIDSIGNFKLKIANTSPEPNLPDITDFSDTNIKNFFSLKPIKDKNKKLFNEAIANINNRFINARNEIISNKESFRNNELFIYASLLTKDDKYISFINNTIKTNTNFDKNYIFKLEFEPIKRDSLEYSVLNNEKIKLYNEISINNSNKNKLVYKDKLNIKNKYKIKLNKIINNKIKINTSLGVNPLLEYLNDSHCIELKGQLNSTWTIVSKHKDSSIITQPLFRLFNDYKKQNNSSTIRFQLKNKWYINIINTLPEYIGNINNIKLFCEKNKKKSKTFYLLINDSTKHYLNNGVDISGDIYDQDKLREFNDTHIFEIDSPPNNFEFYIFPFKIYTEFTRIDQLLINSDNNIKLLQQKESEFDNTIINIKEEILKKNKELILRKLEKGLNKDNYDKKQIKEYLKKIYVLNFVKKLDNITSTKITNLENEFSNEKTIYNKLFEQISFSFNGLKLHLKQKFINNDTFKYIIPYTNNNEIPIKLSNNKQPKLNWSKIKIKTLPNYDINEKVDLINFNNNNKNNEEQVDFFYLQSNFNGLYLKILSNSLVGVNSINNATKIKTKYKKKDTSLITFEYYDGLNYNIIKNALDMDNLSNIITEKTTKTNDYTSFQNYNTNLFLLSGTDTNLNIYNPIHNVYLHSDIITNRNTIAIWGSIDGMEKYDNDLTWEFEADESMFNNLNIKKCTDIPVYIKSNNKYLTILNKKLQWSTNKKEEGKLMLNIFNDKSIDLRLKYVKEIINYADVTNKNDFVYEGGNIFYFPHRMNVTYDNFDNLNIFSILKKNTTKIIFNDVNYKTYTNFSCEDNLLNMEPYLIVEIISNRHYEKTWKKENGFFNKLTDTEIVTKSKLNFHIDASKSDLTWRKILTMYLISLYKLRVTNYNLINEKSIIFNSVIDEFTLITNKTSSLTEVSLLYAKTLIKNSDMNVINSLLDTSNYFYFPLNFKFKFDITVSQDVKDEKHTVLRIHNNKNSPGNKEYNNEGSRLLFITINPDKDNTSNNIYALNFYMSNLKEQPNVTLYLSTYTTYNIECSINNNILIIKYKSKTDTNFTMDQYGIANNLYNVFNKNKCVIRINDDRFPDYYPQNKKLTNISVSNFEFFELTYKKKLHLNLPMIKKNNLQLLNKNFIINIKDTFKNSLFNLYIYNKTNKLYILLQSYTDFRNNDFYYLLKVKIVNNETQKKSKFGYEKQGEYIIKISENEIKNMKLFSIKISEYAFDNVNDYDGHMIIKLYIYFDNNMQEFVTKSIHTNLKFVYDNDENTVVEYFGDNNPDSYIQIIPDVELIYDDFTLADTKRYNYRKITHFDYINKNYVQGIKNKFNNDNLIKFNNNKIKYHENKFNDIVNLINDKKKLEKNNYDNKINLYKKNQKYLNTEKTNTFSKNYLSNIFNFKIKNSLEIDSLNIKKKTVDFLQKLTINDYDNFNIRFNNYNIIPKPKDQIIDEQTYFITYYNKHFDWMLKYENDIITITKDNSFLYTYFKASLFSNFFNRKIFDIYVINKKTDYNRFKRNLNNVNIVIPTYNNILNYNTSASNIYYFLKLDVVTNKVKFEFIKFKNRRDTFKSFATNNIPFKDNLEYLWNFDLSNNDISTVLKKILIRDIDTGNILTSINNVKIKNGFNQTYLNSNIVFKEEKIRLNNYNKISKFYFQNNQHFSQYQNNEMKLINFTWKIKILDSLLTIDNVDYLPTKIYSNIDKEKNTLSIKDNELILDDDYPINDKNIHNQIFYLSFIKSNITSENVTGPYNGPDRLIINIFKKNRKNENFPLYLIIDNNGNMTFDFYNKNRYDSIWNVEYNKWNLSQKPSIKYTSFNNFVRLNSKYYSYIEFKKDLFVFQNSIQPLIDYKESGYIEYINSSLKYYNNINNEKNLKNQKTKFSIFKFKLDSKDNINYTIDSNNINNKFIFNLLNYDFTIYIERDNKSLCSFDWFIKLNKNSSDRLEIIHENNKIILNVNKQRYTINKPDEICNSISLIYKYYLYNDFQVNNKITFKYNDKEIMKEVQYSQSYNEKSSNLFFDKSVTGLYNVNYSTKNISNLFIFSDFDKYYEKYINNNTETSKIKNRLKLTFNDMILKENNFTIRDANLKNKIKELQDKNYNNLISKIKNDYRITEKNIKDKLYKHLNNIISTKNTILENIDKIENIPFIKEYLSFDDNKKNTWINQKYWIGTIQIPMVLNENKNNNLLEYLNNINDTFKLEKNNNDMILTEKNKKLLINLNGDFTLKINLNNSNLNSWKFSFYNDDLINETKNMQITLEKNNDVLSLLIIDNDNNEYTNEINLKNYKIDILHDIELICTKKTNEKNIKIMVNNIKFNWMTHERISVDTIKTNNLFVSKLLQEYIVNSDTTEYEKALAKSLDELMKFLENSNFNDSISEHTYYKELVENSREKTTDKEIGWLMFKHYIITNKNIKVSTPNLDSNTTYDILKFESILMSNKKLLPNYFNYGVLPILGEGLKSDVLNGKAVFVREGNYVLFYKDSFYNLTDIQLFEFIKLFKENNKWNDIHNLNTKNFTTSKKKVLDTDINIKNLYKFNYAFEKKNINKFEISNLSKADIYIYNNIIKDEYENEYTNHVEKSKEIMKEKLKVNNFNDYPDARKKQ